MYFDPSGVAHDYHTDSHYWVIEGGQASVFVNNRTHSPDEAAMLYSIRDGPFSLEFDWITRRLLWVEDGERVSPSPWSIAMLSSIIMHTVSRCKEGVCGLPPEPFAGSSGLE